MEKSWNDREGEGRRASLDEKKRTGGVVKVKEREEKMEKRVNVPCREDKKGQVPLSGWER